MNKFILLTAFVLAFCGETMAFCGFYVAKADADLFNESSQVIMVRDGNHTVITMSNDFKGEVKDFAMIVPVPEVLSRKDIRVIRPELFSKLDAYTAPRMVEYRDPEPNCPQYNRAMTMSAGNNIQSVELSAVMVSGKSVRRKKKLKVKVKAKYKVEEYDIVILSAKQSDDLEKWLTQHGYKIPENAKEALEPYVKSGMNFFVVKVNLERQAQSAFTNLRPLQIQFNSPKFMLPIRLGMANAKSAQDMIVYAFTKTGRVETTNYRTLKVPTNREIPHVFKTNGQFGNFYKAVFEKHWKDEGKNGVFLEYAWDLSATNPVKCDPCNTPLVTHNELAEAGVWWLKPGNANSNGGYVGDLHVTRLHVRYSRDKFPQDLAFMVTPNKERFQGRYVVRIPARGPFNCPRAETYLKGLEARFQKEVVELVSLTGWDASNYQSYVASVPRMTPPPPGGRTPALIIGEPTMLPDPNPNIEQPKEPTIDGHKEKVPDRMVPKPAKMPAAVLPDEVPEAPESPQPEAKEEAVLPQKNSRVEPGYTSNSASSNENGIGPLSGILLALSGLILGAAFFLRKRKPHSEKHSR